jgi:hypothetical protein
MLLWHWMLRHKFLNKFLWTNKQQNIFPCRLTTTPPAIPAKQALHPYCSGSKKIVLWTLNNKIWRSKTMFFWINKHEIHCPSLNWWNESLIVYGLCDFRFKSNVLFRFWNILWVNLVLNPIYFRPIWCMKYSMFESTNLEHHGTNHGLKLYRSWSTIVSGASGSRHTLQFAPLCQSRRFKQHHCTPAHVSSASGADSHEYIF